MNNLIQRQAEMKLRMSRKRHPGPKQLPGPKLKPALKRCAVRKLAQRLDKFKRRFIARVLRERGWTVEAVAVEVGVTVAAVKRWEAKGRPVLEDGEFKDFALYGIGSITAFDTKA